MEKLHFRIGGVEPDLVCLDLCTYLPSDYKDKYGTKVGYAIRIGSAACQMCEFCRGFDLEEQWIKCSQYNLTKNKEKSS